MQKQIYLLLACLALSDKAYSKGWRLLDTEKLELEYYKLNPHNRDPYAPQYTGKWRERAAINWDSTFVAYRNYRLFWDHHVHTETIDSGAVKTVGWKWAAGVQVGKYLDILHHHHSRHIMDERVDNPIYGNKQNQFPVEDAFVLRIKFINREKR